MAAATLPWWLLARWLSRGRALPSTSSPTSSRPSRTILGWMVTSAAPPRQRPWGTWSSKKRQALEFVVIDCSGPVFRIPPEQGRFGDERLTEIPCKECDPHRSSLTSRRRMYERALGIRRIDGGVVRWSSYLPSAGLFDRISAGSF